VDLVGLVTPSSLAESKYFMLIEGEFPTYMHVYFFPNRITEESLSVSRRGY